MEDLRDTGVRLHEPGQPWLKREEEFVGVVLWAVGITTLAFLPDTGVCTRSMFGIRVIFPTAPALMTDGAHASQSRRRRTD